MAEVKPIEQKLTDNRREISWQTDEYIHYKRSQDWYWLVGLIAVLGIILSLVFANFLLAIIIIIGTFTVLMLAHRPPEKITVVIDYRGIKIKNFFYPYRNLGSFAINEEKPAKLLIHTSRLLMPNIYIPIEEVSPIAIKDFLRQYLPEDSYEESLSEAIMEKIGF